MSVRYETWEGIYTPTDEERAADRYGEGWAKFYAEVVAGGWKIGELRVLRNQTTKYRFIRPAVEPKGTP